MLSKFLLRNVHSMKDKNTSI
ncbi:unnamed protein product [Victoria cruziana]